MRDGERRVVVTGMGAVTPIGNDVASYWDGLVNGRSGIGRITLFDPVNVPSKVAGEIRGFDADAVMPKKEVRRNDRYVHFAWAATAEALRDAGLPIPIEDEALAWRTGAIIGSGIGGINTMIRDIIEAHDEGIDRIGPFLVTAMIPDMAAGYVAIYANARGPNYATVSACSSSNHAIGASLNAIRRGEADVMIAGGAEAGIGEIPVGAFCAMRALSTKRNDEPEKASRPFDAERDGFVMGDGAGILVLEELEHARARGATIHAEVVGYGATDDASHITLPAPGGRGAVESMRIAIEDAGLSAGDVDYINAHGTSTPPNDRSETAAIKTLFGEQAYRIPVSSTKSMTGHLMGAGGGIEAIATIRAIQEGVVPPTINQEHPDPDCDLDYVPNEAREHEVTVGMSNSFGFGGHNATLVFRRYDG
ncbi:MAG TPA: beta-ketoacyl-ACP synthase II [Candidatus Limnocylindrales bacterium]|jgi:3-oxoacyl-[acyl-carrier-protein] synthase II|nr:beta-ketoacyl-ACP synthase II [Candidatus Limnocylindrales bacterium]